MQRKNIFGGHFLGSCVCNHTFTIILFLWQEITKRWNNQHSLNWMLETTKPICTEKEVFKVIYPQEGKRDIVAFHCCVISGRVHSLILLVKAALMTLSNCPWVSPPTHQNIFVTYRILCILYSYTNTSTLLLCTKPVKSSLSKSLNITTNLPCNQWTDEKA